MTVEEQEAKWREDPIAFMTDVLQVPMTEPQKALVRQMGRAIGKQRTTGEFLKFAGLMARSGIVECSCVVDGGTCDVCAPQEAS